MSLLEKAKQSSFYTLSGRAAEQVATLAITWLLITRLSVEEYGVYNLLLGVATYLEILTSVGLISGFQRYLPEFFQRKQYGQFRWTVTIGLTFRFIVSLLVIGGILASFGLLGPFLKIEHHRDLFAIFAFGLVFRLQAEMLKKVLEAMFLHKFVVFVSVFTSFLYLGILCVIFYFGYGLKHVLLMEVFTSITLMTLCYVSYLGVGRRALRVMETSEPYSRRELVKRVSRYSGFSFFNETGVVFIDVSTDFLVIAHYLGPIALSYYAFASRLGRIISKWFPTRIVRTVVVPVFFARYAETGDKRELARMFCFLSKLNGFIIFPFFVLVAVFGEEIIRYVFDPKYLAGYAPMLILLVHYMMGAFPCALPLQAVEKPEMVLIGKLSSVYNLIMDIILIQFWGIEGVALATSSAMVLKKGFEYAMSKKYAGITFPWQGMTKIALNCAFMAAFALWIQHYVTGLWTLLLASGLSVLSYTVVASLNKTFLKEERVLINKVIGKDLFVF